MKNKNKFIQIPNGLISNQLREDSVKVSPKTTYLYVWLKILQYDFENKSLKIQLSTLKEKLGWKTNPMLKNHLGILKDLGYINYQNDYDEGKLKPSQYLNIEFYDIKTDFTQLSQGNILNRLFQISHNDFKPDKALRLCLLIKCYTNKKYGYCWLTYEQIRLWGDIRKQEINNISTILSKEKLIRVTKGTVIKDTDGKIKKENNKYNLFIN
jgi:hypothetical protein